MHFRLTAFSAYSPLAKTLGLSLGVSLGLMACGSSPTGVDDASDGASLSAAGTGPDGYSAAGEGLAGMAANEVGTMVSAMGAGAPLTSFSGPGNLLFDTDLDSEDAACWDDRNTSGYARSACGAWGSIGSAGAKLAAGRGRDGSSALQVTFSKNEEVGGASLALSADVVNVRAYYNFSEGFDFGQGVKIGRISSFNEATQKNDVDIIMTVRSPQGGNQCGLTDMADLGLFFNGKPTGYDWGSAGSATRFERGRWYAVEYQVKLNTPGMKDGSVKLWVDGSLVASKEGLNIRGTGGNDVKLNRLRIGGWYSNGAHGNSGCASPSQASTMHIDDVAVGADFIGVR
jgi:hypothetical protein